MHSVMKLEMGPKLEAFWSSPLEVRSSWYKLDTKLVVAVTSL
jgi:hypothetical protein